MRSITKLGEEILRDFLFVTVCDTALIKTVWSKFKFNLVSRKNLNIVHTHFTGDVT